MKKKVVIGLLALSALMCGCGAEDVYVNVENQNTLNNNVLGYNALEKIGNGLYYDKSTRIVYLYYDFIEESCVSAYYAPNGLPYKYNPETNTLEEISCQ